MSDSSTGQRCDRCGAGAKALYLTAERELTLCGHHDREHGPAIVAAGFERYELSLPSSVGADA